MFIPAHSLPQHYLQKGKEQESPLGASAMNLELCIVKAIKTEHVIQWSGKFTRLIKACLNSNFKLVLVALGFLGLYGS